MANAKPDFRIGDRVVVRDSYGGYGDMYVVMSEPLYDAKNKKWCMTVHEEGYRGERLELCEDFMLVERKKTFWDGLRSALPSIKFNKELKMKLSKPAIVTAIILGTTFLFGLWLSGNYNSLVAAQNQVDNSWAKVETQYQRRLDLIDNVVTSVHSSQKQEIAVFGQIAEARKQYTSASTTDQKAEAATKLESTVAVLPRLQEAYPELKSNEQVTRLINELSGTENTIAGARNQYNDTVTNYNTNVTRFPKNVFANLFGFEKAKLFKAQSGAEKAPKVNL